MNNDNRPQPRTSDTGSGRRRSSNARFAAAAFLAVGVMIFLSVCNNPFSSSGDAGRRQPAPEDSSAAATLKLTFLTEGLGASTVLPQPVAPGSLTYVITLSRDGYADITSTSSSIQNVPVGEWLVQVTGFSGADAVFGALTPVTVGEGITSVEITLLPLGVGEGEILITIDLSQIPGMIDTWHAAGSGLWSWGAEPNLGSLAPGQVTLAGSTLTYDNSVCTSGLYEFRLALEKDGVPVVVLYEIVHVYDNRTSMKTITLQPSQINAPPEAPAGLGLSREPLFGVGLSWTDTSSVEEGFKVYRRASDEAEFTLITTGDHLGTNTTSYLDAVAEPGEYIYRVVAFNDFGDSAAAVSGPIEMRALIFSDILSANGSDTATDLAVDSLNRIVIAGHSLNASGDLDVVVLRLNPDFSLDTSFGTNGLFTIDSVTGPNDRVNAVAIDSQNRIIVGGIFKDSPDYEVFVLRVTETGVLDTGFGSLGGLFTYDNVANHTTHVDGNNDTLADLLITADDSIIACGDSAGSRTDAYVFKLTPAGILDTGFAINDGTYREIDTHGDRDLLGYSMDWDGAQAVLEYGGDIYFSGYSQPPVGGNVRSIFLGRLTAAGIWDNTFAANGNLPWVPSVAGHGGNNFIGDGAFVSDSSGDFYLAGRNNTSGWSGGSGFLLKTDAMLNPIPAFRGDGRYIFTDDTSANNRGNTVALDESRNRVYVGGYVTSAATGSDVYVAALDMTTGALVSSFADNGVYRRHNVAGGDAGESANAMVVLNDGRIALAGSSASAEGDTDMVLWIIDPD